jgi:HEAT repeat protein
LIAILEDPDSQGDDLAYAADELARWGPAAAPAVPALRRALRYPYSSDAQDAAAEALGAIGPAAAEAVPDLVEALEDDYCGIRAQAAYALGSIGESAECAVPALAERLWDSDECVQICAAKAIDVIAGVDLVAEAFPRPGWRSPLPCGGSDSEIQQIMTNARTWWIEEGQYLDWSGESNLCNPSSP